MGGGGKGVGDRTMVEGGVGGGEGWTQKHDVSSSNGSSRDRFWGALIGPLGLGGGGGGREDTGVG